MRKLTKIAILSPVLLFTFCGDSGQDASSISNALAERLTDALAFDAGEAVNLPPPPSTSDPAQPQIQDIVGPATLTVGQPFAVSVTTDWPNPSEIKMAVVWVKGSKRHIWVTKDIYPAGSTFTAEIGGLLKNDPDLVGKSFTVLVALQIADNLVGAYKPWVFTIEAAPGA